MNRRQRSGAAALLATALTVGTVTACSSQDSSSQNTGQRLTERAFEAQQSAVPYPIDQLHDSAERRNLRERLLRFNKPDRIGYVYLLTLTGTPIGYYTIEGKISSPNSQMTTTTHVDYSRNGNSLAYPAPGDDGSYGPNEPGVFFFTTEGALIETNQNYLYSDQPVPTFTNLPKFNGSAKIEDLSPRK
ncbi:MAG: hypothetical protein NVS3B26_16500 [Mycobacteriales bacterium]